MATFINHVRTKEQAINFVYAFIKQTELQAKRLNLSAEEEQLFIARKQREMLALLYTSPLLKSTTGMKKTTMLILHINAHAQNRISDEEKAKQHASSTPCP